MDILVEVRTLRSIKISSSNLTDKGLLKLRKLPQLEELWIGNTSVTGAGLTNLVPLKGLKLLQAPPGKLDKNVKKALRELSSLEKIYATWYGDLNDEDVRFFSSFPKLKVFQYGSPLLTDAGLEYLCQFPALEEVALWAPRVTAVGFSHIPKMQKLHTLHLAGDGVRKSGDYSSLKNARQMKHLELDAITRFTDEDFAFVKDWAQLESIRIDNLGSLTSNAMKHLEACSNLQVVWLLGTRVEMDVAIQSLAKSSRLREFVITNAQMTDANVASIVKFFPDLERLHVKGELLSPEGCQKIGNLRKLKALTLRGSTISDEHLAFLSSLENLTSLDLSGTAVCDPAIVRISAESKIRSLDLSGCKKITDVAMDRIGKWKSLEALRLDGTQVGDAGVARISSDLPIRYLHLVGTSITDKGLEKLPSFSELRVVTLKHTNVSPKGIESLRARFSPGVAILFERR